MLSNSVIRHNALLVMTNLAWAIYWYSGPQFRFPFALFALYKFFVTLAVLVRIMRLVLISAKQILPQPLTVYSPLNLFTLSSAAWYFRPVS